MALITLVGLFVFATCTLGQHQNYVDYDYQVQDFARPTPAAGVSGRVASVKPTPVPIIKQINRHNDDGSYTYGYEGADGSFKIETKLPTGEVSGKYGYVDDTGKLRVVDYGANRYGFQPAGDGITVAPPTLVDETTDKSKQAAFSNYDEEGVLYARAQPQTVARPAIAVARQNKRPQTTAARPIQYVPQPQPQAQLQPQPQAQPQFITFEAAARRPVPVPTPVSVPHFQPVQQAPAQFPQQVQQHQQFPQAYFAYEEPRPAVAAPQNPIPNRSLIPGIASTGPLFRAHAQAAAVPAAPSPAPVREHHARASSSPSGSVLDSLIQQYALPQGVGQPLHDISFGSYSSQTNF